MALKLHFLNKPSCCFERLRAQNAYTRSGLSATESNIQDVICWNGDKKGPTLNQTIEKSPDRALWSNLFRNGDVQSVAECLGVSGNMAQMNLILDQFI